MKSLIKIFGIAFLGAVTFTSCLSDDAPATTQLCNITVQNFVTDVTGPSTGTVGQQITLNVKFSRGNMCYVNSQFLETGTNPKTVIVSSSYVGCTCTPSTDVLTKEYKFTPATAGEYEFKFQANETFVTKTVTVTQ